MSTGDSDTSTVNGVAELARRLDHDFKDLDLLRQALTHTSAVRRRARSYERLEFLGDRVIGLVLARMLFDAFPDEDEGELGYRFTALAQQRALARIADDLNIGALMELSGGEQQTGGRDNPALLADVMEAIVAAVYLDGGLTPAEALIRRHWTPLMAEDPTPPKDAKTVLQEFAQGEGRGLPRYRVVERSGPDHEPVFKVEATIDGHRPAIGDGTSKRAAEQQAAAALLADLGIDI